MSSSSSRRQPAAAPAASDWPAWWPAAAGVGVLGTLYVGAAPFLMPAFRKHCLPYVAANACQVNDLLLPALRKRNAKRVIDLGSGDGRVCIEAAHHLGVEAVGYELNPWLVLWSRFEARRRGVGHLCSFHRKDLFKAPVAEHDAVVLFVVPAMAPEIETMLEAQLAADATVYSCRFPLDRWVADEHTVASELTSGYNVNQMWEYTLPNAVDKQGGEGADPKAAVYQ